MEGAKKVRMLLIFFFIFLCFLLCSLYPLFGFVYPCSYHSTFVCSYLCQFRCIGPGKGGPGAVVEFLHLCPGGPGNQFLCK
jgi:hypothetical protein